MHETYTPSRQEMISILSSLDVPRCFKPLAMKIAARAYDHGMANYAAATGYAAAACRELVACEKDRRELNLYVRDLELRLDGAYHQLRELEK